VVFISDSALFSVPLTGGPSIPLFPSAWLAAGGVVEEVWQIPGSAEVLFKATESSIDEPQLYRIHPDGTGLTKLTNASDLIQDWINRTGTHAAFEDASGLYSVTLTSTPVVTPLALEDVSSFSISPDGTTVFFTSYPSATLFSIPITGGVATELAGNAYKVSELSSDGTLVIYQDYETRGWNALPVSGGTPVSITSANNYFTYDVGSSHAVDYVDDVDDDGVNDLVSVSLSTGAQTHLSGPSLSNTGYVSHEFTPDNAAIIYRLDEVIAGRFDVFYVLPDGTSKVNLTTSLPSPTTKNIHFTVSPDSSSVFYSWDGAIYEQSLSSGSLPVLRVAATSLPAYAKQLGVSPNGHHVIYQAATSSSASSRESRCFVASNKGGSHTQVLPSNYVANAPPVFSPDSAWLLLWAEDESGVDHLLGYRIADGMLELLCDTPVWDAYAISADSGHVVFQSTDGHLYRAALDGSSTPATQIDTGAGAFTWEAASFSPDGTQVAVLSSGHVRLCLADSSSPPMTLDTDANSNAHFTPDGQAVIYSAGSPWQLRRFSKATGTVTTLYAPGNSNIRLIDVHLASANHALLKLADSTSPRWQYQLVSVELSTGAVATLVNLIDEDFDWKVDASGTAVMVLITSSTGQQELWAVPLTGGTLTKISGTLPPWGDVKEFAFSPDGSTAFYRADLNVDEQFELFSVPVAGGGSTLVSAAATLHEDVVSDWQIAPSGDVVYRSDVGNPGYYRLYRFSAGSGSIVQITPSAMPAQRRVREFVMATESELVAYTVNLDDSARWDAYAVWGAPDVSVIADQYSLSNAAHGPLAFNVHDWESGGSLQITVQSSNAGLLDPNNAVIGGSGTSRTLTLTPNSDAWGRSLVTLLVSDGSFTTPRQFTWTVTPDANDLPTNIALAPASIQENQPAGTLVGYLSASDADPWDIHSYSLVSGSGDGDNHLFLIDGGALRATVPYDFEARSAFSIRVRVTDFVGATFEKVLFVSVLDLRGISQPVTLTTREGMGRFFEAQDFIDRFLLQDGGSLTKIRIESAPMNGTLNYQFGRRDIDTAANAARALATGDVNGDGRPDIIAVLAGSGDLVWYENGGGPSPTFTRRHIASVLNQPRDVAVGDVDKDGDLDVFVAEHGANKILCFRSSGGSAPTFAPITVFSGAGGLSSLTTADIDGDTDLDVISTHPLAHRVMIHRNDGAATPGFIGSVLSTMETGAADAVVFDADLDGDLDIVSAAATSGDVAWFEQNGASFIRRAIATGLPQPASLARADINGDSRSDLVIATSGDNSVNWYQNIPPATSGAALAFMPNLVSSSIAGVTHVLATDFTGDNVPDIIACSPVDGRILGFQTFRGASVGFATHQLDKNAAGAAAVASTDFTANGRPDLVAGHASANTIAWYQDERLLIGGDEVTVHELHKLRYQPHMSFTGDDAFGWRGHDGVQWSFHPSVVTLKVIAGEYWDWLVDAFGVESVSDFSESVTTWGDSADADGDGRSNLLEYAFGGDPTSGSDSGDAVATAPQTETDGTTYFHLSFIMRHSDPGLIYTPEVTADFTTWNSGPTYFQHVAPDVVLDADFTQVTYRYLVPVTSGSPAGFFRIEIERAP
jgi:hypothetical protein